MAARDEWSVPLKCPMCGKQGEITFSEDDHPYMNDDTLRVEELSPGFLIRSSGKTSKATKVECADCKELAK